MTEKGGVGLSTLFLVPGAGELGPAGATGKGEEVWGSVFLSRPCRFYSRGRGGATLKFAVLSSVRTYLLGGFCSVSSSSLMKRLSSVCVCVCPAPTLTKVPCYNSTSAREWNCCPISRAQPEPGVDGRGSFVSWGLWETSGQV